MLQAFTKYGGMVQTALGLLGAVVPGIASGLGTGTGSNIFNILSGAGLSYLGFQGNANQQRTGALGIGGVNAIIGLLSAFGVQSIAGIPMNEGALGTIVNLVIGAWGLISGFMKKPAQ
jgi:hypothetical protein